MSTFFWGSELMLLRGSLKMSSSGSLKMSLGGLVESGDGESISEID